MPNTFNFTLPDVFCPSCIEPVKNTLKNKSWEWDDGGITRKLRVTSLEANYVRRTMVLTIDSEGLSDKNIRDFIIKQLDDVGTVAEAENIPHVKKALIGIISGTAFLMLSIFAGGLPVLATYALTAVSTLLSLYLGKEIFIEAFKKITRLHSLEMNALFSVSALTAMTVSIVSLFVPWLPCMLDAALLTFGFRHLGLAIEDRARQRVIESMSFKQRAPRKTLLKTEYDWVEADISTIKVGDVIRVKSGQVIPLDGKCLTQNASLDISIVDGSIHSQNVKADFEIAAGMQVKSLKPVDIKVTRLEEDSFLARLDDAILRAETKKAPLESTAHTMLKYFVPGVFILAGITAGVVSIFIGPVIAIQCAILLLVSACPCTLGSIVPLGVTVAIEKAARQGVLFKSGKALQAAAETTDVIFDLNGTLTEGDYQVTQMNFFSEHVDEQEYQNSCLYELERDATHPIGIAIRKQLEQMGYPKFSFVPNTRPALLPHHAGKQLIIDGQAVAIGNSTLMRDLGIDLSEHQALLDSQPSNQIIFFASEKSLLGYVVIADSLKKDALFVVNELKAQGKEVHICTGADRATAEHYAQKLGIPATNILADCIPIEDANAPNKNLKANYISDLKSAGKTVAMIGDAENDAIPLSNSNLGIFVKSKANAGMMRAKADVIIQNSALTPILISFQIGSAMVANIKQNLFISFGYNFVTLGLTMGLLFGLGFALNPAVGVALMIAQASGVFMNVYRFKHQAIALPQAAPILAPPLNNTTLHKRMGLSLSQLITHQHESKATVHPLALPATNTHQLNGSHHPAAEQPDGPVYAYRK
jgi:Cu2+-exporting ATPase